MNYKGKFEFREEDATTTTRLSSEEIVDMIKKLHSASNGISVGFSVIFNVLASNSATKEDAYKSVEKLSEQFRSALDRYYNGELEVEPTNGVKVIHSHTGKNIH